MNEAEWASCTDPRKMLQFLGAKASDRKLLLFAVACCRRIWPLLEDGRSQRAVQVSEAVADGLASAEEQEVATWLAIAAKNEAEQRGGGRAEAAEAACAAVQAMGLAPDGAAYFASRASAHAVGEASAGTRAARAVERAAQAALLRDLFGNPFRTATILPALLAWQGGTIPRLAQAAYDDRDLRAGTLQPVRLTVLADACEEAGCDLAALLDHLRGPGPHVRGCWAVDLLLQKP